MQEVFYILSYYSYNTYYKKESKILVTLVYVFLIQFQRNIVFYYYWIALFIYFFVSEPYKIFCTFENYKLFSSIQHLIDLKKYFLFLIILTSNTLQNNYFWNSKKIFYIFVKCFIRLWIKKSALQYVHYI